MDKTKIMIAAVLLAAACLAGGLAGWKAKDSICRQEILDKKLEIERMEKQGYVNSFWRLHKNMELLTGLQKAEPSQQASWRARPDEKELEVPPPDCQKCLEKVKREVVVKDEEHGWWVYRDPDVLDDKPGRMEITGKLFEDTAPDLPLPPAPPVRKHEGRTGLKRRFEKPPEKPVVSLAEPVTSVKAGTGLHEYQLEIEYAPLRLEGTKADISVVLGSRITMDHHTSDLRGDLSAGIELRW